ncbi:hypothetical protein MIND_00992900 [Mycena indigotica]|uniref:Uncharacterized protein n=1 Tax=Mycena indigotica TaxID=2126181 RepID=A0A8H6W061_9AGAR|nr:uncharacterized protein MIND_00992900 [Mycena indigotica]KAF7294564.1 hypothetical protein MIND_00992900 [Mycena indigotica]
MCIEQIHLPSLQIGRLGERGSLSGCMRAWKSQRMRLIEQTWLSQRAWAQSQFDHDNMDSRLSSYSCGALHVHSRLAQRLSLAIFMSTVVQRIFVHPRGVARLCRLDFAVRGHLIRRPHSSKRAANSSLPPTTRPIARKNDGEFTCMATPMILLPEACKMLFTRTCDDGACSVGGRHCGECGSGHAYFNNDVPIGSFKTTWTVPPAPAANHGQTIFLFNSIEPGSFDGIMQPVLQWGRSAAGGGPQWMLASWYLYPGGTFFSPLVGVSVGQRLQGEVRLVGASGGTFNYLSSFTNVGGTGLEVDGGPELKWATLTLESYGVTTRDDYPAGSTVFSATNLQLTNGGFPNINWATVSDTADGITTTVQTQGSTAAVVTITY